MVVLGPPPDWDAEVWVGPAGGWALPDHLTTEDRDWLREQLQLAGARRNTTLEAAVTMAQVLRAGSVSLSRGDLTE